MIIEIDKSLETVLQEVNKSWYEQMEYRPDLHNESGRLAYCFGWLQSSYKHLLEECNKIKNES